MSSDYKITIQQKAHAVVVFLSLDNGMLAML